jgi:hypothetical protein
MRITLAICALLLPLVVASSVPEPAASAAVHRRRYHSIFSFGDSFADTGNNPAVFAWYSVFDPVTRPPYGSTFFGRPTGRNADGRLILDFIGKYARAPRRAAPPCSIPPLFRVECCPCCHC